ncbi:hypothetical protein MPTK1_4g16140 [Marchantia polymorpha subsp. ruderalis]
MSSADSSCQSPRLAPGRWIPSRFQHDRLKFEALEGANHGCSLLHPCVIAGISSHQPFFDITSTEQWLKPDSQLASPHLYD